MVRVAEVRARIQSGEMEPSPCVQNSLVVFDALMQHIPVPDIAQGIFVKALATEQEERSQAADEIIAELKRLQKKRAEEMKRSEATGYPIALLPTGREQPGDKIHCAFHPATPQAEQQRIVHWAHAWVDEVYNLKCDLRDILDDVKMLTEVAKIFEIGQ